MRRYAAAARRGAESPKMQCAALERRRRRRAWRITDLASSGSAAPDTPSTTVSCPLSPPVPLRPASRRRRPGPARPHAPPDRARPGYAFRLYLLFVTAAVLHFAISRRSKRGTAAGGGTKRRRKQCLVLNKEKEIRHMPIIDGSRTRLVEGTRSSRTVKKRFCSCTFISRRSRVKELHISCL